MKILKFLLVFLIFVLPVSNNAVIAQYKISGGNHADGAELAVNTTSNSADEIVSSFFEFAVNGDLEKWGSLLSKSCFSDNSLSQTAVNWYTSLQETGKNYYVLNEVRAPRRNQKIYLLDSKRSKTKNNQQKLILVKELGKWKVLYAKL